MKLFIHVLTFVLLLGIWPGLAHGTPVSINCGDILKVYMIDQNGSDLIAGSFSQSTVYQRDPHELTVSVEGRVFVPHVGLIHAVGKSPFDIEEEIKARIMGTIQCTHVAVLLSSVKYHRVYIIGEVNSPGMYRIDLTKPAEMKIMNVVNMAGGFTDRAQRQEITIISSDGKRSKVNLMDIVKTQDLSNNALLADGDTILVGQSLARVYVLGEVKNPGGYRYIEGAGFTDYLAEAGGLNPAAEAGNIGIVRKDISGKKATVYKTSVNGDFVSQKKGQYDILPGDIVYVPKSFFADWKDIGTVLGIARDYVYISENIEFPW